MISKKDVQKALNRSLSGLQNNPDLIQQIAAMPIERIHKKKIRGSAILALVLVSLIATTMAAGIAINGKPWGVLNWILDVRPDRSESNLTMRVVSSEAGQPYERTPELSLENNPAALAEMDAILTEAFETDSAVLSIREAVTDGYGIYLSIAATPASPEILLLNWDIDPFESTPEVLGQMPDHPGQSLAEWAVGHGYRKLIRLSLLSPIPAPYTHGRLISSRESDPDPTLQGKQTIQIDSFMTDRVSMGSDFDSLINARMMLEEDGTSLIMIAGGFTDQRSHEISFCLIPWRMTPDGKKDPLIRDPDPDPKMPLYDTENLERGKLSFTFSSYSSARPVMLAEYEGEMPLLADPEKNVPVCVQFFRTVLNDYCLVRCNDSGRIFEYINVFEDVEQSKLISYSQLFVSCYQLKGDEISYLRSCIFPKEFPDQISLRWDDYEENLTQMAVVKKK